jgi:hypothetical protein
MKSFLVGLALVFLVTGIFFKDVFLSGKVLLPGDIVVGMYYPWLSEKWGYEVGVPVKNPIISDVVSAVYVWKKLVADSYRQQKLPLWNSYSYSGYPLLANFQSGALYPFNLLMVLFGDIQGWNLMLIGGVLGGAISMFLFLKNKGMGTIAAVVSGISYAFSAYAITWMEFVTTAQMMVWFPLMFLSVDLAIRGKNIWRLLWPAVLYMAITAGRFEVLVYMLVSLLMYVIYVAVEEKRWRWVVEFGVLTVVGIVMGAAQILPTVEMSLRSVRFEEAYIGEQRWGLIPVIQLMTGLAPDFFGNPTTGNYWGWWHYHETVFYTGIVAAVAFFSAFLAHGSLKKYRFFVWMGIAGLLLGVDGPIGQFIYKARVPILSTASAGRVFLMYVTGAAILAGWWVDNIRNFKPGFVARSILLPTLILVAAGGVAGFMLWGRPGVQISSETAANLQVAIRNSVLPLGLLGMVGIVLLLRKTKYFAWAILFVVVFDLTRAGWKYLPMVEQKLIFPKEQILDFLTQENSKEIFRIDREHGELLPPNMWAMYGLMSPSGYDPLASKEYASGYSRALNGVAPVVSRYSELQRYNAQALGKFNVKYLLALKRDEKGKIPGTVISKKIDMNKWKVVKETNEVAVLENSEYQPRAVSDQSKNVTIAEYTPGKVVVKYSGMPPGGDITLAEGNYPGWVYCEEGNCTSVENKGMFMAGKTTGSEGKMTFVFRPESVKMGLMISGGAIVFWLGFVFFRSRKKLRIA